MLQSRPGVRARAQFPEHSRALCGSPALFQGFLEYQDTLPARLPGRVINSRASWALGEHPDSCSTGNVCPGMAACVWELPGFRLTPPNPDWAGKSPAEPLPLLCPVFVPPHQELSGFPAWQQRGELRTAVGCSQDGSASIQALCPLLCIPELCSLLFPWLASVSAVPPPGRPPQR